MKQVMTTYAKAIEALAAGRRARAMHAFAVEDVGGPKGSLHGARLVMRSLSNPELVSEWAEIFHEKLMLSDPQSNPYQNPRRRVRAAKPSGSLRSGPRIGVTTR